MLDVVVGLPVHPLIVHATVVLVPAAALAVALAAVWPPFRRWAFVLPLLLALAALLLVPLTVQSGEALEERVGETPLVETHADLGEGLLRWVLPLAVIAAGLFWLALRERRSASAAGSAISPGSPVARWITVGLAAAALFVAGGTIAQTIAIGHSGATAAWSDVDTTSDPEDD
ncbi:MAG TPA: DUF2231 domain-containing protein [Actinotalea sp.]|nr:DUF2231 domain-containing protein [Actinotalea sp.]